jgi:sugar/nucleoside kinase (ribokinase family)
MEKRYDIFGLSNTLMDFLIKVDDEDLEFMELKKGMMHLIDEKKAHNLIDKYKDFKIVPAGAVTNTLMGISVLGGKSVLCGNVGYGEFGELFKQKIVEEGVISRLNISKSEKTGKVISFVTPDAERTFGVYLGAAVTLDKSRIQKEDIVNSKIFYFTGYELEALHDGVIESINVAKENGVLVGMDLADPGIIERNFDKIKGIINDIDVLFMNENEAKAYTGFEPEKAAETLGKFVKTVVAKVGEDGSIIINDGKKYLIEPFKVIAVDTTGAGDLFAAGFLYALVNGKSIEEAGKLGSYMGAKIVSQMGALLSVQAKVDVVKMLESN